MVKAAFVGKLSEEERVRLLKIFDTVVPAIRTRPAREVDGELGEIRAARRRWGRRGSAAARDRSRHVRPR